MKRLLTLSLFMCLAAAALAQAKPDYQNTRMPQTWSNWSGRFNKSLAMPSGTAPAFPAYVADSSKRGSLFTKTGGAHDRVQHYDAATGTWLDVADATDLANYATTASTLNQRLLNWTLGVALSFTNVHHNGDGVITTADIKWPDKSTGTWTTDAYSSAGGIAAYHVTYVPASGPTKTITQPLISFDANAWVTNQPDLIITP